MTPGPFDFDLLPALAREAHERSGHTKAEAARILGVTPQAYAQALGDRKSMQELRRRIIEEFSDFRVVGPEYRLEKKDGA